MTAVSQLLSAIEALMPPIEPHPDFVPVMVSVRMRDELRHVAYEMEISTGQRVTDDDALEYLIICRITR